jgi:predicted nucleic acid-binding protein
LRELLFGAVKSAQKEKNLRMVDLFLFQLKTGNPDFSPEEFPMMKAASEGHPASQHVTIVP